MFDKLFKPKPLDQFENGPETEPEIKVEEPPTENSVRSEKRYEADVTVKYDREAIFDERRYEAKIQIYRVYSHSEWLALPLHRRPNKNEPQYVTTLIAAGPDEDSATERASERCKEWLAQQKIIDNPKKFKIDL